MKRNWLEVDFRWSIIVSFIKTYRQLKYSTCENQSTTTVKYMSKMCDTTMTTVRLVSKWKLLIWGCTNHFNNILADA